MNIQERLFLLADEKYKRFQAALIPTLKPEKMIGVRTPQIRELAKSIYGTNESAMFLRDLPHKYFDENNLHAFLIEMIGDFDECIKEIELFLPYVDNWATCDSMSPKALKKDLPRLEEKATLWIKSENTYTARFGICILMKHFIDDKFSNSHLELVASIKSNEYYIKMAMAWYFSVALAKQYETALKYIESKTLPPWVHRKSIQKACESLRITPEQKKYLRSLK